MLEQGSNLESDPSETTEIPLPPYLLIYYGTTQFKVGASVLTHFSSFSKISGIVGKKRLFIPLVGLGLSASAGLCLGGVVVNNLDQLQGMSGQGDSRVTPQANSSFPEITATPISVQLTPVSVNRPEKPEGDESKLTDPGNPEPDNGDQPPKQAIVPTSTRTSTPTPTRTATPTPEPTDTPRPTNTPRPTSTPPPSATPRPQPSNTPRPDNTPTRTPTVGSTPTKVATLTPTKEPTRAPSATQKPAPSSTPNATPTGVRR